MHDHEIQSLADELYYAERNAVPIPPLTKQYDTLTITDAYAIQMINIERAEAMGYGISGKKIGLTSPGMQRLLGVDEPDYGHLFSEMDCADATVDSAKLIGPKVEAEIAFILSADLTGPSVSLDDVRKATEYVVGAFEIVDSRVADWKIKLADTVADNASSGRYILGEKRLRLSDVDLAAETMKLYKNGSLVEEGVGANVLGDPCIAVAWLANKLLSYGVALKKGEIVLSGAFSAAPEAAKGDIFNVEFSSFGTIKASFI